MSNSSTLAKHKSANLEPIEAAHRQYAGTLRLHPRGRLRPHGASRDRGPAAPYGAASARPSTSSIQASSIARWFQAE